MRRFLSWLAVCLGVLMAWAIFVGYVIKPGHAVAFLLGVPVGVPMELWLASVWMDEFA